MARLKLGAVILFLVVMILVTVESRVPRVSKHQVHTMYFHPSLSSPWSHLHYSSLFVWLLYWLGYFLSSHHSLVPNNVKERSSKILIGKLSSHSSSLPQYAPPSNSYVMSHSFIPFPWWMSSPVTSHFVASQAVRVLNVIKPSMMPPLLNREK